MSIARQPYLTDVVENELKQVLSKLWTLKDGKKYRYSANQISIILKFGKKGHKYEKLKPHSVYHYRSKFGLPSRKPQTMHTITEGGRTRTTRYAHQPKDVMKSMQDSPDTYLEKISETYPLDIIESFRPIWDQIKTEKQEILKQIYRNNLMYSAYNIVQMYSPLRKSEIYERSFHDISTIVDSETKVEYLTIGLFRKKKGEHNQQYLPYDLKVDNPGMDIVLKWLEYRRKEIENDAELIFPITSWDAWNSVKKIDPEAYPHYFRFEYITEE